eukprot:1270899-Rhodomonas_salina.2
MVDSKWYVTPRLRVLLHVDAVNFKQDIPFHDVPSLVSRPCTGARADQDTHDSHLFGGARNAAGRRCRRVVWAETAQAGFPTIRDNRADKERSRHVRLEHNPNSWS